jgi:hypothetical protein
MTVRRSLSASAVMAAILASAMSGGTMVASASPADEPAEAVGCQYTLTAPELVQLPGGAKAVRATLNPKTCDPAAQPTDVTVCLAPPNGQGECKRMPGWALAEVLIPASPSNGTFTATGNGCWMEVVRSFQSACRTSGPVSSAI